MPAPMKAMLPRLALLALIACLPAPGRAASPADDALAWLKSVDEQFKQPRLTGLTVEKLKTLTEVNLGGHRKSDNKHIAIPAAEFRHLAALPALRKATLWEIDGLDDSALAHIGKVATLRELELGDAAITSAGLKHLRGLRELTFLGLGWTKDVTDAGLPELAALPNLEVLVLSGTKVTDAGLAHLSKLSKLREVRLGTLPQVTDAGLLKLKDFPALKLVVVNKKTGTTPAGIAAFKQARPGCEVVVK
jgi:internalin A